MNPPKGMFLVLGLVLALIAAACGDDDTAATTTTAAPATTTATTETPGEFEPVGTDLTTPLPAGDVATGEQLFGPTSTGGFSCTGCHVLEELTEEFLETFPRQIAAPSMFGIAERAGTTREGYSAEEYLRESIVLPCELLTEGPVCLMPRNFGERMDAQNVADLIAFLMTQSG